MGQINIRKDDLVMVISGKDKGKTGKVLKVFPNKKRAIVEKVNFAKEFLRQDQSRNVQGGIMEKEAPIHLSNLELYCSQCGRGVKEKKEKLEDGNKIRICSKCKTSLERQK
ncbi:50S ribosomal protein L24 [bacterium]|nr:50S ribosomal protein L24 [bacterium]